MSSSEGSHHRDAANPSKRSRSIKTESELPASLPQLPSLSIEAPVSCLPSRKRPRTFTFSPSVSPFDQAETPTTGRPKMDLQTPGAHTQMGPHAHKYSASSMATGTVTSSASAGVREHNEWAESEALRAQEIAQFLRRCNLSIANSSSITFNQSMATVHRVATNLVKNGFDNMMALSFISHRELLECGLQDPMDQEAVFQQARRGFDHAAFRGPGAFKLGGDPQRQQVAEWIRECGIADPDAQHYAMKLFHQGYYTTEDLRLILHDKDSLRLFKVGHLRLFVHCVQAALQEPSPSLPPSASKEYELSIGSTAAPPPTTPTMASLEQSYLETLLQTTPIGCQSTVGTASPWVSSISIPAATPQQVGASGSLHPPAATSAFFSRPLPSSSFMSGASMVPTMASSTVAAPQVHAHSNPTEYANLMSDATAVPTVLSPRRSTSNNATSEMWTEERIALLQQAVADPRCRHLSKVRWEVLANGATGSPEYAPLSIFSSSQLRSRYRSLFGDKRPERVRERKRLLRQKKKQQQQQSQSQTQQQQPPPH